MRFSRFTNQLKNKIAFMNYVATETESGARGGGASVPGPGVAWRGRDEQLNTPGV